MRDLVVRGVVKLHCLVAKAEKQQWQPFVLLLLAHLAQENQHLLFASWETILFPIMCKTYILLHAHHSLDGRNLSQAIRDKKSKRTI